MRNANPRVVIGMPVFNGEQHIGLALESILDQTVADFKVLVSDNCSTDGTEEICREFAKRDRRIEYRRQDENLGMLGNFSYVLRPGNAPYFKWASHDDIHAPEYLARCLDVLDTDDSLAIAHTPSLRIDGDGRVFGAYRDLGMSGDRISERFWRVLWSVNMYEIFGVMRSEMIARARPMETFFGAERNLLAEVLLQGDIAYVDEPLFFRRQHDSSLTAMHIEAKAEQDFDRMMKAHDPKANIGKSHSSLRKARRYISSILRFPMSALERAACFSALSHWVLRRTFEDSTGLGERYRWELIDTHATTYPNVLAEVERAIKSG